MRFQTDAIGVTAVILILLAYVLFGCVFLFRKKPPQTEEAKRSSAATLGIVLQFFGFALAWNPPRPGWWPFLPSRAGRAQNSPPAFTPQGQRASGKARYQDLAHDL